MATDQPVHDLEDIPNPVGEDGVDVSLIRWMLSLTPDERLHVLNDFINSVLELQNASKDG